MFRLISMLLLLTSVWNALYFKLKKGETKWFSDDLPEGTILKANIEILDNLPVIGPGDGVLSSIYFPKTREVSK